MAGETTVTIVGNLTADPELRYTTGGAAVANFTVASTPRTFDRNSGQWRDGETLFMRCSVWREIAENIAGSLTKGTRVIVQGRLTQRSYETRDGQQRTTVELQVDEVGPSLRYARAQITRTPSNYGSDGGQGGYGNAGAFNPGNYGNQGNQGGYPQGGNAGYSGGGYQSQSNSGYNAAPGGSANDPWATEAPSSADSEPPF